MKAMDNSINGVGDGFQCDNTELVDLMVECRNNPLKFANLAFPWGEVGTPLEHAAGLDKWQVEFLTQLGALLLADPFNGMDSVTCRSFAVTSGHGVGKSALSAMLILWLMSTRPYCKGTVTANTNKQLKTKTWGELSKWWGMCITKDWFEYHNAPQNMSICHVEAVNDWRADAVTCKEDNSEAFAGQHASQSSSWYLFDEASGVPDIIWEVSKGGRTDGEPFHFVFGNPTQKYGNFYECFNSNSHRWNTFKVDSRDSSLTNKATIKEFKDDYGEDSDFFKIRVLGEFPSSSDSQFIASEKIDQAVAGEPSLLGSEPLICGIDVARGGADYGIIQFRRGNDARSHKKIKVSGYVIANSEDFIDMIEHVCRELSPDMIYIDETGMGGPIKDRLVGLGLPCTGVHFGSKAMDANLYLYKTAEMWYNMRNWINNGGCVNPNDGELISQLRSREFSHNDKNQLVIESKDKMKARGQHSPDDADALALTFAYLDRESSLISRYVPLESKKIHLKNPLGADPLDRQHIVR